MSSSRKKRALWKEEELRAAMKAVNGGMSVRTASVRFNIPRRTLRNHLTSGEAVRKLGRSSYLTEIQEKELCSRIFRLCEIGVPLTGKVIQRSVYSFCETNNIENPFNKTRKVAGRKWLKLFLQRNPEVSRRKAQSMNPGRAAKLNRIIVKDYFHKLQEVMTRLDVMDKPHLIYNIDEKGCRLALHKQPTVFAKKGEKRVHIVAPEHGENVSIVSCGNALGQVIPPMILYKGKRLNPCWKDNLPPGTEVEMTEKGSMTTATFIKWLHHFTKFKPTGNVLLIFDGASSHLDAGIVNVAEMYGITLFCLPSNTTHELQPMDKSVFGPFEKYWDDEILLFWSTKQASEERNINKSTFGKTFSKVWPKATTPANVSAGFRATGIYPFDPSVIHNSAFGPSELTRKEETEEEFSQPQEAFPPEPQQSLQTKGFPGKRVTHRGSNLRDSSTSTPDSSPDEEEISETSFHDIIHTPKTKIGLQHTSKRRKALNYEAIEVKKELFRDGQSARLPKAVKDDHTSKKNKKCKISHGKESSREQQDLSSKNETEAGPSGAQQMRKENWFCFVCNEDRIADMRLCVQCYKYVHEACVGLTSKDREPQFICPACEA